MLLFLTALMESRMNACDVGATSQPANRPARMPCTPDYMHAVLIRSRASSQPRRDARTNERRRNDDKCDEGVDRIARHFCEGVGAAPPAPRASPNISAAASVNLPHADILVESPAAK